MPHINEYAGERREWLNQIKLSRGCFLCGTIEGRLIFHHLDPSKKTLSLNRCIHSYETIEKEIEKCIILCNSCHTKLHQAMKYNKEIPQKYLDLLMEKGFR
jgi:hypothetical protein